MGGGKKSKSKKKKSKVQQAAAKRHANFKKTLAKTGKRVQTFGGTKKKYSKAEARALEKAHGGAAGFSRVTGGAANPLNRAPDNRGIKAGDVVQPIKDFNESLGNDYSMFAGPSINYDFNKRAPSDISFSDAVRMSGARFNEAGRNELSGGTNLAYGGPDDLGSKLGIAAMSGIVGGATFLKNKIQDAAENLRKINEKKLEGLGDQSYSPISDGTLTATNYNDLSPGLKSILQNQLNSFEKQGKGAGELKRLQKMYPGFEKADAGMDMSGMFASTDLAGTGIKPVTSSYDPGSTAYALQTGDFDPASYEKFKASQQTAGGLNIGGNFGLSAEESDRLGRVFQQTSSPRMLSEGGDLRMSDMFEADTQGAKISKGINAVKNRIPILNKLPDMKINTVAEEAQRRYLGYNPNLPASALARMNKKGGGTRPVTAVPTMVEEILPQAVPVASASTTPATQTGIDPNRLLQIQQQAYAQAYNPMSIGGFNPQFRFGAATPTIDYSTYFNY